MFVKFEFVCWLLEKSRLSPCIIGVSKVAQPNANQAKALLWTQGHTFSEGQGDAFHGQELVTR